VTRDDFVRQARHQTARAIRTVRNTTWASDVKRELIAGILQSHQNYLLDLEEYGPGFIYH
jgi:hypothetical protein